MLEPWLREFGFIICYGAIVLKLYRHLVEFRTRKAHRYVVRDLDLLRYLCAMIVAVLCYLAAFTALCFDYLDYSELIWNVEMENVTTLNMCKPLKWDYVSIFLFFFSERVEFNNSGCFVFISKQNTCPFRTYKFTLLPARVFTCAAAIVAVGLCLYFVSHFCDLKYFVISWH
jgi:hypothetical protein